MNNQKDLLLKTLSENENLYGSIQVKGVLINHQNNLYPNELIFFALPKGEENIQPRELDYSEFLFIEDTLNIKQFKVFINSIGEKDTTFRLSNYQIIIPKGLFRYTDDDRTEHDLQMEILKHSGPLNEAQRKILKGTRSYPNSKYQTWPVKTFLFEYDNSNLNIAYYNKYYLPLSLKQGLPALPNLGDAINWWLDKDGIFFTWNIIFYLPDYNARITEVKLSRNKLIISIEVNTINSSQLTGKYFINYESYPAEEGEVKATSGPNFEIKIKDNINKFYFVLTDTEEPNKIIDYRIYDFRRPDRADLDYIIDEEDVEYRISQGENESTEFKLKLEDESKEEFLESICSFSNSYGGIVILGVDDNSNIKGITEDRIKIYEDKIQKLVRDWIEPAITIQSKIVDTKGKNLLVIMVQKGENPPYNYIDHGIYIRAGSTDRIAARDELLSLMPTKNWEIR